MPLHHEQLQKLKAGNSSVETLTWSRHNPVKCAGIGDQFYRIQQVLIFAIAFKRVLSLHWNQASYETMKYLQPNKIDCASTKVKACMNIMNLNLEGLRQWTLLKNLDYCTSY